MPFQTPIAPSFCQSWERTSRREFWRWRAIFWELEGEPAGEGADVVREGV